MNSSGSRRPIAITGATLIDGTGRPPLVDAPVVIDGGRVSRIGPTTPAPEGAEIIDARGRFSHLIRSAGPSRDVAEILDAGRSQRDLPARTCVASDRR